MVSGLLSFQTVSFLATSLKVKPQPDGTGVVDFYYAGNGMIYFLNFLRAPASPIKPVPSRSIVVGSGTADPVTDTLSIATHAVYSSVSCGLSRK